MIIYNPLTVKHNFFKMIPVGPARTERPRTGSWSRRDAPFAQEEAAFSYRRTQTSESGSISVHCSTGPYLGQLRVVARSWSRSVL